jgi:hypothetical protein
MMRVAQAVSAPAFRGFAGLVVLAAVLLGVDGRPAQAWDVLGCDLTQPPNRLKSCLDNAINDRINQTQHGADQRLNDMSTKVNDLQKRTADAEARAAQVRTDIENGPFFAKLQSERDVLAFLRTPRAPQLLQCVGGAGLGGNSAVRFGANPAEFARGAVDAFYATFKAEFAVLMSDELARVRDPRSGPLDINQVFDMVWRKVKLVAQRQPALRCVVDYLDPEIPRIKAAVEQAQRETEQRMRELFEQHVRPLMMTAFVTGTSFMMDKAFEITVNKGPALLNMAAQGSFKPADTFLSELDGDAMNAVARGVVARYLLDPARITAAADRVHDLAVALPNPAQRPAALTAANAALDASFQPSATLYIDVGMELFRYVGKKWIESDSGGTKYIPAGGTFIVDQAIKSVESAIKGGRMEGTSLCGFGDVPATSICTYLLQAVEYGWDWVGRPVLKWAVVQGIEQMFSASVDYTTARLKATAGVPIDAQAAAARQRGGPLVIAMDQLQTAIVIGYADDYVRDTRNAIEKYNRSVRELANLAGR